MARVIWKFVLRPVAEQTVEMPHGAELLHLDLQYDELCVWASVHPDAPKMQRAFALAGTGHETPNGAYLGSVLLEGGSLVVHVFDEGVAS